MNVYLDTNAVYTDPFLTKDASKILLTSIAQTNGTLFISKLVYQEILNNYEKQLLTMEREIKKKIQAYDFVFHSNALDYELYIPPIKESVEKLKERYSGLVARGWLEILDYENLDFKKILDELTNRSLQNIRPFVDGKEEFKDSLTWLIYVNHVESCKEISYFVSNDKSAFYRNDDVKNISDKTYRPVIHDDLLKDTSLLMPFTAITSLVNSEEFKTSIMQDVVLQHQELSALDRLLMDPDIDLAKEIETLVFNTFTVDAFTRILAESMKARAQFDADFTPFELLKIYDGIHLTNISFHSVGGHRLPPEGEETVILGSISASISSYYSITHPQESFLVDPPIEIEITFSFYIEEDLTINNFDFSNISVSKDQVF